MPNVRPLERRDRPIDPADEVTCLGYGRFHIATREPRVRVPDLILKCVGFVGEVTHKDASGIDGDLCGTGFFVGVPSARPGHNFHYFVTAKHVATDLKDREIYFLVNKRGGGTWKMSKTGDRWWFHASDKTADVAIVPVEIEPEMDVQIVRLEDFLTPQKILDNGVGVGDEVFMTGLFTHAPGIEENMPIVRYGNVAMMPREQIQTELGFAEVYLVEARSIGGLSGSPVFVRETLHINVNDADGTARKLHGVGHMYLMGLAHGHWDIKESEMNDPYYPHDPKNGVNLGIGIVVPATKIMEVLNRPELIAARALKDEEAMRAVTPGMD
jgi:hypothetical protein